VHKDRSQQAGPPRSARRLEEIFGREPDADAADTHADSRGEERARENWYRENRPPHHEG